VRRMRGGAVAMDPQDVMSIPLTVRISPRMAEELDRLAGPSGTRSGAGRDAMLAGLQVEDTARRPARRRKNYRDRQDKQQRGSES
jgi:hypothetical protein